MVNKPLLTKTQGAGIWPMGCSLLALDLRDNGSPGQVFILILIIPHWVSAWHRLILFTSVFFCVCVLSSTLSIYHHVAGMEDQRG